MAHWTDDATEPYLRGYYRPVQHELDLRELEVIGEIPRALSGVFMRNGPNQAFAPRGRYHPFDGDGMLHAVHFEDGRARYKNRYIRTPGFLYEQQLGRAAFSGFAELRPPEAGALKAVGPFKNVANTHVIEHAGRVLALWEGGLPTEVTRELDTIGMRTFEGAYNGPFTAHPCFDPRTGELVAFGYNAFPPFLTYLVLGPDGTLTKKEVVEIPQPVMMHAFAITERYALFLDAPAIFAVADAMQGKGPIIQWKPEHGCRFGVLPRNGSGKDVRWFELEPCYVYHFMNAYEEGDLIHVDAGRLERLNTFGLTDALTDPPSTLSRFTLDLARGSVTHRVLDDRRMEFPRIHDGYLGVKHTIGYGATYSGTPRMADYDITLRYDLARGTTQQWFHGQGRYVGELVFTPDPAAHGDEAKGWLLGYVYDSAKDQSELVIFDAPNVDRGPVARVLIACRVPTGIHASFLPARR